MAEPDFWIPETFQLNEDVRAIETSPNNPKVRMDETGLFVTDSVGNIVTFIRADGGAVDLTAGTDGSSPTERRVRWLKQSNGDVIADIQTYENNDGGRFAGLQTYEQDPRGVIPVTQTFIGVNDNDPLGLGRSASVSTKLDMRGGAWPQGTVHVLAQASPIAFAGGNPGEVVITDENGASNLIKYARKTSNADIRLVVLGGISVPALAVGATSNTGVIDTGFDARDNRDSNQVSAGPLSFSFVRVYGTFLNLVGSEYNFGYVTSTTVNQTIGVQFQFRNNSTVAGTATSFLPMIIVGYA